MVTQRREPQRAGVVDDDDVLVVVDHGSPGALRPPTVVDPLGVRWPGSRARYDSSFASVEPISAGVGATAIPASSSAAILSDAAPLPPEMIAPAWPMRLPGGAVLPPMNDATGFRTWSLMNCAARSSESPPISPIMKIDDVPGSSANHMSASMKSVPFPGSPPMPIAVDCPSPSAVSWCTTSYVSVPERDTTPTPP